MQTSAGMWECVGCCARNPPGWVRCWRCDRVHAIAPVTAALAVVVGLALVRRLWPWAAQSP